MISPVTPVRPPARPDAARLPQVRFAAQTSPAKTGAVEFYPSKPRLSVQKVSQWVNYLLLKRQGLAVTISPADLRRLKSLPRDAGVVVAANHPSPTDRWVMLELSRRWGRTAHAMAGREVFEFHPWLGRFYQALGAFSVERGRSDDPGKLYALDLLRRGNAPLLIFPESDETLQTERVLPLKPGSASLTLKAASESERPIYILPLAIRYRYRPNLQPVLDQHLVRLEQNAALPPCPASRPESACSG